jgi:transcriptional regulator with XRE-family HTH domain
MTPDDFRAWRKRMGWTKVRAARELGISQASVSLYEKGERYDLPGVPVTIPRAIVLSCKLLEQQHATS